jgi:vacuolar-type H+-ATPase catalytic subunit A/Vma1
MENLDIVITRTLGQKEVYAHTFIDGQFFAGVAICNKKDEFVLQTGIDLATQRLKAQVAAYLIKQNEKQIRKLLKQAKKLMTKAEELEDYRYDVLEEELSKAERTEFNILIDEDYRNYYEV